MISLIILMVWTLALTVAAVWFVRRAHKTTQDEVVLYMAKITPEEMGAIADKVYDARSEKS